jgi:hypothetical protein
MAEDYTTGRRRTTRVSYEGNNILDSPGGSEYAASVDDSTYVQSMAGSVFAGVPRRRRMWAMLNAFIDESGTHAGSRLFVVAALLAPPEQWDRMSVSWERKLRKEHLDCFHATDCAVGGGDFKHWPRERRNSLYAAMAGLVAKHACYRAWTVTIIEDYFKFFKPEADKFLYHLCLDGAVQGIRELARQRGIRIPCVFDRGGLGGGFARNALANVADYHSVGAITDENKEFLPPLQAADLHVYEVYKHFTDMMTERRTVEDGPRGPFGRLWKLREAGGGGIIFDNDTLPLYLNARKMRVPRFEMPRYSLNLAQRIKITPYRLTKKDFANEGAP